MKKIKISVVSYLNSKPFIYGLQHSEINNAIDLRFDIPSDCFRNLLENKVDIGLIPSAMISEIKNGRIISDYCIGAVGKVASVMLYSNVPLNEIKTVLLDYQSKTSVELVKILAHYFWKINPQWVNATTDYENKISDTTAAVIIGDRTFGMENKYPYQYDLAEEWQRFTHLPFVFACWVANKELPEDFIKQFNQSLKYGLDNREVLIKEITESRKYDVDVKTYLTQHIQYDLDENKKKGLQLFLDYYKKLNQQ